MCDEHHQPYEQLEGPRHQIDLTTLELMATRR